MYFAGIFWQRNDETIISLSYNLAVLLNHFHVVSPSLSLSLSLSL